MIATGHDKFVTDKSYANYISVGNDLARQMQCYPGLALERSRRISKLVQRSILILTSRLAELTVVFSIGVSREETEVSSGLL
jgi:hypothetical protein